MYPSERGRAPSAVIDSIAFAPSGGQAGGRLHHEDALRITLHALEEWTAPFELRAGVATSTIAPSIMIDVIEANPLVGVTALDHFTGNCLPGRRFRVG